jgi:Ca-activated chloride channel family protein
MSFAKEADTPIYAVGIHTTMGTSEERQGPLMLHEMTEATGGRHFMINRREDLVDVITKIGYLLRNRYVLGYRPVNSMYDGKWHKIKVRLDLPPSSPHLTAYAKSGYYAARR